MKPIKRTFEAAKFPPGSPERAALNANVLTSAYAPSKPWLVQEPFLMSDGSPHPRQPFLSHEFRTKSEAEAWIKNRQG